MHVLTTLSDDRPTEEWKYVQGTTDVLEEKAVSPHVATDRASVLRPLSMLVYC
jgi:hypothetical protein